MVYFVCFVHIALLVIIPRVVYVDVIVFPALIPLDIVPVAFIPLALVALALVPLVHVHLARERCPCNSCLILSRLLFLVLT